MSKFGIFSTDKSDIIKKTLTDESINSKKLERIKMSKFEYFCNRLKRQNSDNLQRIKMSEFGKYLVNKISNFGNFSTDIIDKIRKIFKGCKCGNLGDFSTNMNVEIREIFNG